jgi:hypothetical protein
MDIKCWSSFIPCRSGLAGILRESYRVTRRLANAVSHDRSARPIYVFTRKATYGSNRSTESLDCLWPCQCCKCTVHQSHKQFNLGIWLERDCGPTAAIDPKGFFLSLLTKATATRL